jgi:hypothetical protein
MTAPTTPLDYSPSRTNRLPLRERINVRLIVFLVLVTLPFLWCLWMILDQRTIINRGDYYEVDLKAMGNFPFDAKRDTAEVIPAEVRELDGKKVVFEGEMYAPDQASSRVEGFQLVYSITECCLGGPPKVQERVFAYVPEGKRIRNYTGRQVTCTGTLHVKLEKVEGETVSVFRMDVDDVQVN